MSSREQSIQFCSLFFIDTMKRDVQVAWAGSLFLNADYLLALIRQRVLLVSSDTSIDPSASTAIPTDRPWTSLFERSLTKPVKKSSGFPEGCPSRKGTNIT